MVLWNADPEMFRVGYFVVRWYSLLFALSFLIGFFVLRWVYIREGKQPKDLEEMFFYVFIGVLVGARLGHVFFYDPGYYMKNPVEIFMLWKGGLASHGGSVGAILAMWLYVKRNPGFAFTWVLDRVAVVIPLVGSIIRIGNLFNSEIYGKPTEAPWAFIFQRIDFLPRHPSQLYEALAYIPIFGLMLFLYSRVRFRDTPGFLVGALLVVISLARFFLEFFKEPQAAFTIGIPLNMGQILTIPFFVAGVYLVFRGLRSRVRVG